MKKHTFFGTIFCAKKTPYRKGVVHDEFGGRGDYEWSRGAEIVRYFNNGIAAIHTDDGDYPVYQAPVKGDELAENSSAKWVPMENGWAVVDDTGKAWWTTKNPPVLHNPSNEQQNGWEWHKRANEGLSSIIVGPINDVVVAITGEEIGGFKALPGEVKQAKENTAMGIITSVGSLAKATSVMKVSASSKILDNLDTLAEVKIDHLINGSKKSSHHWEKLVPDKDWNRIKGIIREVLEKGDSYNYKNNSAKIREVNGHDVVVTYYEDNGVIKVGSSWINE